jgi:streptogramin lyase
MTSSRSGNARWTAGAHPLAVGAIVIALCVLMSCNGTDPDDGTAVSVAVSTESTPSVATGATPGSATTPAPSFAPPATTSVDGQLPSLPLPGFAFEVGSEFEVVRDLRGLAAAGGLLFAFTPPDTMWRIDPARKAAESVELGIGPSAGGAPSWVVTDDAMWLIGGAFRDQLIEVDTTRMTEVRRIDLDDDHTVAAATATDVWLMTAHAVRRFDIVSGTLVPPIELDVDPGSVAVAPDGSVWVSLPVAAQVAHLDPATGHVDAFDVAPGPGWIAADHTAVWVSHPPIASVSRLDPLTGETIDVIDLDLSAGTVASAQTGALQALEDGVWVIVSFPGSRYRSALALIDPSSGVIRARSIQFDSHTWEAVDGAIWIHRLDASSIIRSSLDDLDSAPPTDEHDLLPAVTTTTTTATTTPTEASEDERTLLAALDMVLDASVPDAVLGLEPQTDARHDLIELAAAQAELHIEPRSLAIDNDTATTVFDVLIEGDTLILPAVELEWHRADDQTWHLDTTSFCRLATGVGITGCTP